MALKQGLLKSCPAVHLIPSLRFARQMVRGLWSQTDLEEQGASCEAVA